MTKQELTHIKMLTEYQGNTMNKQDSIFYKQDLKWAIENLDRLDREGSRCRCVVKI